MEAAEILREKKKCFDVLAGFSSAGDLLGFALGRPTISSTKKKEWKYRKQSNDRAFILFYFCYSDYFIKNPNMGSIFQRPKRSVRGANPGNF